MPLNTEQNKLLESLAKKLKTAAGTNLESLILYGSAAEENNGFHAGFSDINVLCLVRSLDAAALAQLAPAMKWWDSQKQPAPMLFTTAELLGSADVFPIELRDIKDRHRVLYGPDPVAALNVPRDLHRVQLEHDFRVNVIKLRQRYLASAGDNKATARLMTDSISTFVTLLRHLLIDLKETPPASRDEIVSRAAAHAGFDAAALTALLAVRAGKTPMQELEKQAADAFSPYLAALEQVLRFVDGVASSA